MNDCCDIEHKKPDYYFLVYGSVFLIAYLGWFLLRDNITSQSLSDFSRSIFEITNKAWWGVAAGVFFVGVLSKIPQKKIFALIGRPGSVSGIFRAVLVGLLFDMCSHGIILVAMQLYRKGASFGQVAAFLLSSPWNSISLTLILVSMIGLKFTLLFIFLSAVVGIITGILIDRFFPHRITEIIQDEPSQAKWFSVAGVKEILVSGIKNSKPIIKWLIFGIILTALIRTFIDAEHFSRLFGPTLQGLGLTLLFATVIEVCSEGSTPIAADILNRAMAAGNSFAFLMAGVATDYTEILAIRQTTGSWKMALLIPLISLPQIILISVILNNMR